MKHLSYYLLCCCFLLSTTGTSQVFINELMASNAQSIRDQDGQSSDWIELYNADSISVDLSNWYLSDKVSSSKKWSFPQIIIPPHSHLLVFASGKDRLSPEELHTNFKLSADGEEVILTDAAGNTVDYIRFDQQKTDQSYGRYENGHQEWITFSPSSPGKDNIPTNQLVGGTLSFSHQGGFYTEPIALELMTDQEGAEIRYTTNGSFPTLNSKLYTVALDLGYESSEKVDISLIPTARAWQLPAGRVQQYPIIRTRAFKNGIPVSPVESATFVIEKDKERFSLPVVSLITEKDNLFDPENGIYILGDSFNYQVRGRIAEIPVHLEYFDQQQGDGFQLDAGLRLTGNTSRHYPQKSLKIYMRSEYGEEQVEYPIFGEEYSPTFKRLILRTFNSDWGNTGYSDDLAHSIVNGKIDMDYSQRKFVIVFINGEYWGLHSLRDAHDEYLINQEYDIPIDQINMANAKSGGLETENGSLDNYYNLVQYIRQNDLSQAEHYDYVASQVDINNLQEILCSMLFFGNADWPHHNNRYWQNAETESKWRWIFFDLDAAFKSVLNDNLGLLFKAEFDFSSFPEPEDYALILPLMQNKTFLHSFRNQFFELLNGPFAPEQTIPKLEEMIEILAPEIEEHSKRWNYPKNKKVWQKENGFIRDFLINRPNYLAGDLADRLALPIEVYPNPATQQQLEIDISILSAQQLPIQLIDQLGRIYSLGSENGEEGANHFSVRLPDRLAPGFYHLQIRTREQLFVKKIVVAY